MVTAYKTPQQFLDESAQLLEERELENNLILGICYNLSDKTQEHNNCVFINAFDGKRLMATSIKTLAKAIVSCTSKDDQYIKALADYYLENNIDLKGAVGEAGCCVRFSEFYGRKHFVEMSLILHQLTKVNELSVASGHFGIANENDIDLITDWMLKFEDDAHTSIRNTREQILKTTQARVAAGNVFKWTDNGKIVSMATVNRKTTNVGIIGFVYTPSEYRGKGYATGIVQQLSEYILQKGFKYCGLFTDKANPTSNHIYKKIGYEPVMEFIDMGFE